MFANEEKIEFDIKNTKQGLSDNDISYIANDGHGFLWLGTNEGLTDTMAMNLRRINQIFLTLLRSQEM